MLQEVPLPLKTLEVLLVKKEKGEIVYLNRRKFPGIERDSTYYRLHHDALIALKAVEGFIGYTEGIDDRRKAVVGAILPVPESNWFLIVKMDKSEAYGELRKIEISTAAISLLLIVALTSSIALFWLRQQGEMKNLERDRKMISDRYDMLSKYANDAILLYSNDLKILQINDIVSEKYGYTREELIGMSADKLRSPKTRGTLKNKLAEIIRSGGLQFETLHQRKMVLNSC
jgi:PAS domain-containing protein